MRSPEPQVVGEVLADDTRTATPPRGAVETVVTSPPVAGTRVEIPPRATEAVGASAGDIGASAGDVGATTGDVGASAGDVGATTSPTVIHVDPIRQFLVGLRT
jgi:hypothetical protein